MLNCNFDLTASSIFEQFRRLENCQKEKVWKVLDISSRPNNQQGLLNGRRKSCTIIDNYYIHSTNIAIKN